MATCTVDMFSFRRTKNKDMVLKLNNSIFPSDPIYLNASSLMWLLKMGDMPVGFATAKGVTYEKGVAFLDRAGLKPVAQGNGLHRHMISVRLKLLKKIGYHTVITYTLHDNLASANNLTKCGFKLYQPNYRWADSEKKRECLYFIKYL